jgi:hypothetical protein
VFVYMYVCIYVCIEVSDLRKEKSESQASFSILLQKEAWLVCVCVCGGHFLFGGPLLARRFFGGARFISMV